MHGPDVMNCTSDAVERPLAVHRVELARLRLGQVHDARGHDLEALLLESAR